jgi:conjugative transfer signal peptidase TraF
VTLSALTLIGGSVVVAAVVTQLGYGVTHNVEDCLPMGAYWLLPAPKHLERGEIVQFCPPENNPSVAFAVARGWLGKGTCPSGTMPMLKQVGALPGDVVTITPEGVTINGKPIPGTPVKVHTKGGVVIPRAVPLGTFTVPPGQWFPIATNSPLAFDGRYFGPLPQSIIEHRATKVD